jgi:hypothetical protein
MTSKKQNLVTGTELLHFLKAQVAKGKNPSREVTQKHFQGSVILDGIWSMASSTLGKVLTPAPFVGIPVRAGNLQKDLAVHLGKNPALTKSALEKLTGTEISKDTFNRAQINVGGVNKFQKDLFEDFVKVAVSLENKGIPYYKALTPSKVKENTGRTDGLRYCTSIKNSSIFQKEVSSRVGKELAPKVTEAPAKKGSYQLLSTITLEPGCDVIITLNSSNQKVIEIVKLTK